jgi:hypothetical protein
LNIKRFKNIDYEFRPNSYWDPLENPLLAILKNVKGSWRRRMIQDYWEAGRIEELSRDLLADELPEERRERLGQINPGFMGGEYLPPYRNDEVEIARIELESTTTDVISVRARKTGDRIEYSVYDEYETDFNISPLSSAKPLSLDQLIGLIDKAGGNKSLALRYTIMNYSGRSLEDLDRIRSFSRVESVFYPQLNLHYEKLIDLWYEEEKRKSEGTGAAE